MEEIVRSFALHLSLVVEALAAIVIGLGLIQLFIRFVPTLFTKEHHLDTATLRVKFGSTLTLSLELLLAADILRTAVAPTWEDIGKLAAIAAIRTILNYFLEKELATIEKREKRLWRVMALWEVKCSKIIHNHHLDRKCYVSAA